MRCIGGKCSGKCRDGTNSAHNQCKLVRHSDGDRCSTRGRNRATGARGGSRSYNGSERTYARRVGDGSGQYSYAKHRLYLLNNCETHHAYHNTYKCELLSPYPNAYLFNHDNYHSNSLNDCAHIVFDNEYISLRSWARPSSRNRYPTISSRTINDERAKPYLKPKVNPPPPFNDHLDPADMEFLRKKVEECKSRKGKIELEEGKVNPYFKIIAVVQQFQREGMRTVLTEPLRKQLQADREK